MSYAVTVTVIVISYFAENVDNFSFLALINSDTIAALEKP